MLYLLMIGLSLPAFVTFSPMGDAIAVREYQAAPPTDPSPGPTDPTPKPSGPIPTPQPPVPKPNPSHPSPLPGHGSEWE